MFKKIFFIIVFFIFSVSISFASINLVISPIKYEIETKTGAIITKKVKIRNPNNESIHLTTGKSDFVPNGENGIPKFVRKSEMVYPDQQLSSWITIDTKEFDLGPNETKTINFTIKVPDNASPGGHYGAVFFKTNNTEKASGTNVGISVDYGVLVLLKVEGNIVVNAEIEDPIIVINGGEGNYGNSSFEKKNAKNTIVNTGTIILKNNDITKNKTNIDGNNNKYKIPDVNFLDSKYLSNKNKEDEENEEDNFDVSFIIPINNNGNIHIKPQGTITLEDEDGKIIKNVGKEIITNEKGAIVGERIVDYIPVNDIGGVVIPGSSRKFKTSWNGFPYKDYDKDGNPIIKYWTPDQYYTKENLGETKVLMPWEEIKEKNTKKKIIANFYFKYKGENGDKEHYSQKDFFIQYKEKYVAFNYKFFYIVIIIFSFILIFIFILSRKKMKCRKCKKTIKKDMKICPYCGTKQKKKK